MLAQRFAAAATTLVAAITLSMSSPQAFAAWLDDVSEDARSGDLVFKMYRKGKDIGYHSTRFTALDDGRLQVDTNIYMKVKFAFIVAFRYEHRNREIWSADGQTLLAMDTQTNNNGNTVTVTGVRNGDTFDVTDQDGNSYQVDGPVMPTSYWNAGLLEPGVSILNTQKGTIEEATFTKRTENSIELPNGAAQDVEMFEAEGNIKNVFVDYAQEGQCWIGLEFFPPRQDVKISYDLESYFSQPRADLKAFEPLAPCVDMAEKTALKGGIS